jgi:glutamine amidotransferase
MCRWITLLSSQEVSLADIVLTPSNSLVQLSKDASFHPGNSSVNNHVMNGDGFGVGWYHHNQVSTNDHNGNVRRVTPPPSENGSNNDSQLTRSTLAAVFKDTQPAWNNINLRELCMATRSDCMIAHVRAASAGTGVSQVNCHPFKAGRLLFCHNGRIETAFKIRRAMMDKLTEEAFLSVRGTTDSECIFALILTFLTKDKEGTCISARYCCHNFESIVFESLHFFVD